MSIIVHKNEPIDNVMKRLHAEAIRENIFIKVTEKRYHEKPSVSKSEKKREWKKRKRRSRSAKRKLRNKGM
jgi:ribosomal protein S21